MAFAPNEAECRSANTFTVHIRPEDFVIPVCHEGMNRSQILYLVFQARKQGYTLPGLERVCVPHGADSGFDPHHVRRVNVCVCACVCV